METTDTAALESERAAKRRREESERQRARRVAQVAAGLCTVCGKPRDSSPGGTATLCGPCAEKVRARWPEKSVRRREKRAAEAGTAVKPLRPYHGVCPHCRRKQLTPYGRANDGRGYRYQCQQCGRTSSGLAPLERPDPGACPCPFCGAPCERRHAMRLVSGAIRQGYRCTACRKYNTDLYPEPPKQLPGEGVKRHKITLGLNPVAQRSLIEYCNTKRMSAAQAVRDIFCKANEEPVVRVSTARPVFDKETGGIRRVVVTSPRPRHPDPGETAALARFRLPDLRADVARARMRRTGEHRHAPTVLVTVRLTVRLDDSARAGLLKTMRRTGLTHQEAARYLLTHARP